VLSAAEGRQREVASKRIFMEVTLLKAIQARESTSLDAVLKQLKTMREQAPTGPGGASIPAATAPVPTPMRASVPAPASAPAPVPSGTAVASPSRPAAVVPAPEAPVVAAARPTPPVVPQPLPASPSPVSSPASSAAHTPAIPTAAAPLLSESSQTLEAIWQVLVAQVPPSEGLLRSALQQSRGESWARGTLTIAHPPDAYLETARNVATLQAVLLTITGKTVTLRFVASESLSVPEVADPGGATAAVTRDPSRAAGASAKPTDPKAVEPKPKPAAPILLNKDEFLNDPLIRQALEVFKGRILEVRGPAEGA